MKIEGTEKVTDEKFLNLYKTTADNNGNKVEWIYASRNENPSPPDAVVIVPFLKEGNKRFVVVVEEFRIPLKDYEWSFPAGLRGKDEDVISCATRELEEETGFLVTEVWTVSPPIYSSAGLSDESVCLVYVECRKGGKQNLELSESLNVHLLSMEELTAEIYSKDKKWSAKAWPLLHGISFAPNDKWGIADVHEG